MHDVARLAGVSHQTVSRVLNHSPAVREETRRRVEQAIRELGYRPNVAARALVTSRSRTIGVVAADTTLFGPASTLVAIEQAARRRGWAVSTASLPDVDERSIQQTFAYLDELAVGATIVLAPQRAVADTVDRLQRDRPLVVVDGGFVSDLPIVRVDQGEGARLAVEHLLSLGHRTVHHVAGPVDWLEAQERSAGWRAALLAAGRDVPEPVQGGWTAQQGHAAGLRLAAVPEVTAVFAANDHTALGVVRALQESGRAVPEQVSVVGFDDVPEAPYFGPALTTVRQPFTELGELAVATAMEVVDGVEVVGGRTPERTVQPLLVVRASSAGPR